MSERIEFLSPVTFRFMVALAVAIFVAWIAIRAGSGRANKLSKFWPIYLLRLLLGLVLVAMLANPVQVTEQLGAIEPSQVFFLLDASESMAMGNEQETRWDQAVNLIQSASNTAFETAAAEISLFRFGRRLKAVGSPDQLGFGDALSSDGHGITFAKRDSDESTSEDEAIEEENVSPADEPDTQMLVALRQISSRFGRKPPAAVVVSSDGRARDEAQTAKVAQAFKKLGVPIHVVPVGNTESNGDVALVSLVLPKRARKQTEVHAQAFLRSYGYDGQQVQLKLNSIDDAGKKDKRLATIPVTLQSGFQPVPFSFRTSDDTYEMEATVSQLPDEVSTDNNRMDAEIEISREKIRVLYVEGNPMRGLPRSLNSGLNGSATSLATALSDDEDIDCKTVEVDVRLLNGVSEVGSFPKSVVELSSFDAIILSDVPSRTFTDRQVGWIEAWVRERGGGLCMVGGRNSFGAGEWHSSPVGNILPVEFTPEDDWQADLSVSIEPDVQGTLHPFFRLVGDDKFNRSLLENFPAFRGANTGLVPKPNLAEVISVAYPGMGKEEDRPRSSLFTMEGLRNLAARKKADEKVDPADGFAAITVGQYGKGRSMAMPFRITGSEAEEFLDWGRTDEGKEYYSQFWRNAVYWLTEKSYVGRRRLIASADKRYYGPGDTITLTCTAFDENAKETSDYRLFGGIEPQSQSFDDIESEYSIVRWPNNIPREEESESPFAFWGERFAIPLKKVAGRSTFQIELALAETLPSGTKNQSLSIELTAKEGETQVDSTSVPIQILHDPFEQQNPSPNHELLEQLASASGGKVLQDEKALVAMLQSLPVERGPAELTKTPVWSNGWLMAGLVGLITGEWCFRRWVGLA